MAQTPDILDIVYAGRNKAYGGYELRHLYPKHVARAMAWSILCVAFLSLVLIASQFFRKEIVMPEPYVFEPIWGEEPTIIPNDPQITRQNPIVPENTPNTNVIPVVTDNNDVANDPMPDTDASANPDPGPAGTGDPTGYTAGIPVADIPNTSTSHTLVIPPAIDPTIYTFTDVKPEFPGGEKAMYKYLGKMKYPAYARDNGITGRVTVRFVVNEDGKVSNVEVLKGIGAGCDEEAKKVISTMPAWKPGKKNGRAVKAYYTMPVFFKLE
jgi:periplasmic protein TonB